MTAPRITMTRIEDPVALAALAAIINGIEAAVVDHAHGKHPNEAARRNAMYRKEMVLIATRAVRTGDAEEMAAVSIGITHALGVLLAMTVPIHTRASYFEALRHDAEVAAEIYRKALE